MQVRRAIRRLWPGRQESRAPEGKSVVLADYHHALSAAGFYGGYRARPWPVERAVSEAYERLVWVYKATEAIAGHAAALPFRIRQGEEVLTDHPLYRVMNKRANPLETAHQFRKRLSAQLLLSKRGAFIEVTRARSGAIVRMDLLPPGRTLPIPGSGGDLLSHYEVLRADGTTVRIEPERVIWLRDPHPLDPYCGVTPLEAAGLSVELDLYARLANVSLLRNDGRPGGVLAVAGEMDPASMDRIESRFGKGPVEAGKLTVIAGEVSYVDLAAQPRDMQYETTATIAKKEILTAFGVPESVIGDASGRTWDNAEQEEWNFWTLTMPPHLRMILTGVDDDVTDDLEPFFDTEHIAVLQRTERARREEAKAEFEAGLISIDEYREVAGREPVDLKETRALYIPTGKQSVPTSEADAREFEKEAEQKQQRALEVAQAAKAPPPGGQDGQGGAKPAVAAPPARRALPAAQERTEPSGKALSAARPVLRLARPGETKADGAESRPDPSERDRLEAALSAALAALMVRLTARTAARLGSPKTRKGTRHWAASYDVDSRVGTKEIDAEQAVDAGRWQEETEQAAHPLVQAAALAAATALADDFAAPGLPVGEAVAPVVAAVVGTLAAAAAVQALRLAVLLRDRDAAGGSMEELTALARGHAETLAGWSEAVAVQAATATVNGSRDAAARAWADAAPGREVTASWNTRRDGRVRLSHVRARGQTRPVGESFAVGESWLRFPGDPDGPPHEVYGCRCWLTHRSTVTGRFVAAPPGARIRMTRAEREALAS